MRPSWLTLHCPAPAFQVLCGVLSRPKRGGPKKTVSGGSVVEWTCEQERTLAWGGKGGGTRSRAGSHLSACNFLLVSPGTFFVSRRSLVVTLSGPGLHACTGIGEGGWMITHQGTGWTPVYLGTQPNQRGGPVLIWKNKQLCPPTRHAPLLRMPDAETRRLDWPQLHESKMPMRGNLFQRCTAFPLPPPIFRPSYYHHHVHKKSH